MAIPTCTALSMLLTKSKVLVAMLSSETRDWPQDAQVCPTFTVKIHRKPSENRGLCG